MAAILRLLLLVAVSVSLSRPAHAEDLPDGDRAAGIAAIAAARAGEWPQAHAAAAKSANPLATKIVRWLDFTRSNVTGRFADISQFIEQNPDWPSQKLLRRQAETALNGESDDIAAAWLKRFPPVSAMGKARAAAIQLARGDQAGGLAALRQVWIDGDFNASDERDFSTRYGTNIRPEDNVKRLDRLLWDRQEDAARRMLPTVPPDYRSEAVARLALYARTPNADKLVEQVPQALRNDPGLVFDVVHWERHNDQYDAAAQLLIANPSNPVRAASWAGEREIVARRLLSGGNADLAYKVIQQNSLSDSAAYSDAEFLSGYIALRFLKNPTLAFEHFSQVLARATTPWSKSRAAYWSGRAADAEIKPQLAAKWYAAGAENMATFYGQLAAHQLGNDAPPHPLPEPKATAAQLAAFSSQPLVQAASLFAAAGDREHLKVFLMAQADLSKEPVAFAMVASYAERLGRIDVAIAVARRSIDAGMPLMIHGYPVTALPQGGAVEHALLLAIVRTESAFDQDAMSGVGARGLMQLMPGTAQLISKQLQLPYSVDRLTSDGIYNLTLGRAYIEKLLEDFGGSYPLAIAAYNAGPGRIRQWLHDYGDPRGKQIDMVDWIEAIPFTETRLYVQRVLESVQMYRGQNTGNTAAFSLAADLAR
ncbi:MAG TPA: lytic transglycosylase domain-containing protein [Stellaceae bacterium]|nr:lytic transglycosylase domain-containing protein [Stellaceae bacterium]